MKKILYTISLISLGFALYSCERSPRSEGLEYASQMYHSAPLDPYSQMERNPFFADGKNLRDPAAGTVARGKQDYYYPYTNSAEDIERASVEVKNPVEATKESIAEGKDLYAKYCQHCHGKTGKGDGPVVASGVYPAAPPSYDSDRVKKLSDGKFFHSITMGINAMGPHGSMLSPTERWHVINYVKTLRGIKSESDTTKKATAEVTPKTH